MRPRATAFTVRNQRPSVKLVLALVLLGCAACRAKGADAGEPARGVRSKVETTLVASTTPAQPSAVPAPRAVKQIPAGEAVVRFAVIGDFGAASEAEAMVAELVRAEKPDFVVTTGDNNYPDGDAATIDPNIGRFYHEFIHPYVGRFGPGATENRFFPALGNHDWRTPGAKPYLDYFTLPNNERYYELVRGDVHLFAIDSDEHEPDGIEATSKQAAWLERVLHESKAAWQIVYMHHPPYSSGSHGSSVKLRWPYGKWGADLVLAGHDHHYERLEEEGIAYVVNGLGGNSAYAVGNPIPGSVMAYQARHGAQIIEASKSTLVSRFINIDHQTIDEFSLEASPKPAP
jgi:tartrate-resistant acid phosphatase type 5